MASKLKQGTALAGSGLVDAEHLDKLRALSVTTVEELVGLIHADPDALAGFTGIHDLARLQADAMRRADQSVVAATSTFGQRGRESLGALPPPSVTVERTVQTATFEAYRQRAVAAVAVAVAEIDGVRVDLRKLFMAVRNQGGRGTCVGHACAAVAEAMSAKKHGRRANFSPQFVYYQSKQLDGLPNDDGTFAATAMPTIVAAGVCAERYWPYEPDFRPADLTHGAPSALARKDALRHVIGQAVHVDERDTAAIQSHLDEGFPVEISVPVYRNWSQNPTTSLTGVIPMPLPQSPLDGGHAMCIVGYGYDTDIAGGWYFVLRNSWGKQWASSSPIAPGHGVMPFLYVEHYAWEAWTARP